MDQENKPELKPDVTLKLYFPVKLGTSDQAEVISELVFRRPKGKDMRDIPQKPTVGDVLKLAGRISGHPPVVFDNLEIPDFNRVTEVVGNFLDDGRTTGSNG